jgi:hypothetical protein
MADGYRKRSDGRRNNKNRDYIQASLAEMQATSKPQPDCKQNLLDAYPGEETLFTVMILGL